MTLDTKQPTSIDGIRVLRSFLGWEIGDFGRWNWGFWFVRLKRKRKKTSKEIKERILLCQTLD